MGERLKPSGIEAIGYVPWGTHLSQLYETKEDLKDILVPYFKAGLESNEFCLWITSNLISKDEAEKAMREAVPDFDKYIESDQILIIPYDRFYLKDNKIKVDQLIDRWIKIDRKVVNNGYDGLRVSADESWIERKQWGSFVDYEGALNKIIDKLKVIVLCTYSLNNCSSMDLIDILQNHQLVLIRKNSNWVLVESTMLKVTKAKLERVNRLYEILSKINHAIIRIQELDILYEEACKIAVEEGLFDIAWIGIVDEKTSTLIPTAQYGYNQEETYKLLNLFIQHGPKRDGIIESVLKNGRYSISHNIREEAKGLPWYSNIISYDIHSCAVFPLIIEEQVIGIMAFYSKEYSFAEQEEVNLIQNLCDDISFAARAIQKEKLKKQIEEELIQSEERYRKIFELSPTAIMVHSQFKILYANLAAAELLGAASPNDIIGENLLNFIHKDYHNIVIDRSERLGDYGVALPFQEEKFIRLDGTVIDVEATGASFPYKDKNAMVSVVRDITERKKLKNLRKTSEENVRLLNEAREYDKLKTEFFANISHELRTPINVILSAIQLLNLYTSDGNIVKESDKVGKYIFSMQQNCYRLLRLVSNIIDITKIDAGFFELQLKNHNIISVVEDITLSVSEYIEHKGIKLLFDTDTEERIMACDSDKIDRVMLNLLSNAVKSTRPGGTILVSVYNKADTVLISVKDNGIGIPEDKIEKVFERFHQVDKSLTRSHEGSGIGLSIVKSLIELHGGTIKVESEYGRGAEFIIELPVKLIYDSDIKTQNTIADDSIEKINIEFSDIYS